MRGCLQIHKKTVSHSLFPLITSQPVFFFCKLYPLPSTSLSIFHLWISLLSAVAAPQTQAGPSTILQVSQTQHSTCTAPQNERLAPQIDQQLYTRVTGGIHMILPQYWPEFSTTQYYLVFGKHCTENAAVYKCLQYACIDYGYYRFIYLDQESVMTDLLDSLRCPHTV